MLPHAHASISLGSFGLRFLMASSKTLMDLFQPAKRLKKAPSSSVSSDLSRAVLSAPKSTTTAVSLSVCKSDDSGNAAGIDSTSSSSTSSLTTEQKLRMEINKFMAKSKRNIRICSERASKFNTVLGGSVMDLEELLVEETWLEALPGEFQKPYAKKLCKFVESEMRGDGDSGNRLSIYPPQHLIFNALNSTPFDRVKVVIIGQDPYHGPGQAMGLSFSVPEGMKIPSSLVNIYKELQEDLGCSIPCHGNLEKWAVQGVLLLNAVLTVRQHQANSHAKKGWEQFTDAVIETVSHKKKGVVFLLWGNYAQAKSRLIDEKKHHILKAAHPSGLSANRGFFGCRHFSRTNQILEKMGVSPIDWQL